MSFSEEKFVWFFDIMLFIASVVIFLVQTFQFTLLCNEM